MLTLPSLLQLPARGETPLISSPTLRNVSDTLENAKNRKNSLQRSKTEEIGQPLSKKGEATWGHAHVQ